MTALTLTAIQQDPLVMSVAQALALANDAAQKHGANLSEMCVTISEEPAPEGRIWRVHYGPRNYVNQRGGDLIVLVDDRTAAVTRVLWGQ